MGSLSLRIAELKVEFVTKHSRLDTMGGRISRIERRLKFGGNSDGRSIYPAVGKKLATWEGNRI
jgi:hypothetical protein